MKLSAEARLPNNSQRTVITGRTGTGKSIAGAWQLSLKNFASFPWLVWDTKKDPFWREVWKMPGARRIGFGDMPGKNGLYYIQPTPAEMKSAACEAFLWKMHKRGRIGNFIDEGYMFDKYSDALTALYTQGRTLNIPMITLTQKPKYLNMFTFSEADFFQVFALNDIQDRRRIAEFSPIDPKTSLRPYHSMWYDVARNSVVEFSPVPAPDRILENFGAQLRFNKRAI
jgi:hypothetical protein